MEAAKTNRRWLILTVLCLSTLVLVIDNMALNVAVPSLARDLGAGATGIQWILDSYILVFAGLLLPAGSLADRFGRRRTMVTGLVLFGAASLAGAFASSAAELIAARVAMGVGGAVMMPSMLSILITVFTDPVEMRKAMGIWSSVSIAGLVCGPVVAGALITWFWWGAVLALNVPVVIVAIAAALAWMPESKGPRRKADPVGALLSATGITAAVWTIIEWPHGGISNQGTLASLVVAIVSILTFVVWEKRSASPMVPLSLFGNRDFSGACFSLVLLEFANGGLALVFTQYAQSVLGYSPTQSGLAIIPMAIAMILVSSVATTVGQKVGNRPMIAGGLGVMACGFAVLATASDGSGFWVLGTALALLGAGGGLAMPAAGAALMGAIPAEHAGVGSALNDTIQQTGAALGVAVLGSVLADHYTAALPVGVPAQAKSSLSEALGVAGRLHDPALAQAAKHAFTTAMSSSFLIGACGVVAAAIVAVVMIRDRKVEDGAEDGAEQADGVEQSAGADESVFEVAAL
jgi:DHA2 family multidrug resistance protein-like MFS transporter